MGTVIGTVTVRFIASGGRHRSIEEIVTHTTSALEKARFAEGDMPLRYEKFEIIGATFEGNT